MKDKILSLLGLIRKANKLVLGEVILDEFKNGVIKYVFVASDASEKTKKRYISKCNYYNIPYNINYSTIELSSSIGRRTVKTIGIIDDGFTKLLLKEGGVTNGETSEKK